MGLCPSETNALQNSRMCPCLEIVSLWRWELKWCHTRQGSVLSSMTGVLVRERRRTFRWWLETQGRRPWDGGRVWSDEAINQGMPRVASSHQKGARKKDLPEIQRECGSVDILISDFCLPELWENKFLLF